MEKVCDVTQFIIEEYKKYIDILMEAEVENEELSE